jgi:hypothetical protein
MRIVEEIPHPQFKITVFSWNNKYIIKLEIGQFEQVYKLNEMDVMGLDDVRALLTPEFLEKVMQRFIAMRADFSEAFKQI